MAGRWERFRQQLEEHGQLDMFVVNYLSPGLREFEAMLTQRTGLTFNEWVSRQVEAKRSLREMASDFQLPQGFRLLHGTLWRWIRRRMPSIVLKEESELPTEPEYRRIIKVWREQEVSSTAEIAKITGLSEVKVKAARRRFHKKSKAAMKSMLTKPLTTAETRRRRWHR